MSNETSSNERELRDLENEIRKFGTPYAEPKPDAAYWASFRTRVMESVEPKPSGIARLAEWLQGHLLVSSLVGVGVAAAIMLGVFGLPQSDPTHGTAPQQPIASLQQPAITSHAEPAPTEPQRAIRTTPRVTKHATPGTLTPANPEEDLASAAPMVESVAQPLLVSPESDYPVSLNELSESELQSVYEGLMSLDSAD